ncbi:hypothetical protein B7486_52990 [cyanobacterium TDX16]|nr:hypothetical protein B7486_52990 [cyanobacterium TDX16]
MTGMTTVPVTLHDKQIDLYADAERISYRGLEFRLAALERIAYKTWIYRLNGAYMGTQFLVKLDQPGLRDSFLLDSKSKDERLDDFRAAWLGVVALLEAHVAPRLAEVAVTTIAGGGEHRFGSCVATAEGLRARRPLARTIPWAQITGIDVNDVGHVSVRVRDERGKEKGKLLLGFDQWDVVLLPRVIARLGGG